MKPAIVLYLAWLTASTLTAFSQSADAELEVFFKEYLDKRFHQRPLEATMLGDHRFDKFLDDVSQQGRERWLKLARQTLKELPRRVTFGKLSRAGQIDFEILKHELTRNIWLAENTRPFEEDPRVYNGYINDSVYSLLAQSTLPKETNIAHSIARMAQIPKIIAAACENLQKPPRVIVETAIRQNRGAIGFYEKGLFDLAGETSQHDALKSAAAGVASNLKEYQKFLEGDLLARSDGDWRLGKRKFARKLELGLDAGLTADQVLADAEMEFRRVRADMYVIARQMWGRLFPKAPLPPDTEEGRRIATAKVLSAINQEHGKPEELIRDAKATVDRIKSFIRENDILRLPDPDRCGVIEMPEFKRGNAVAYFDSAPPLDPLAASFYAISPPPSDWDAKRIESFLEEYNQHMLQILTIHEAYPGHYVQLEYSNRTGSLIRRLLHSGVFTEGWAVYTEQTMLDQGYGAGDLRLRMMQLKFYLRAVANAILDHKMHCAGMADDDALNLLMNGAFQSEGEARLKIIRSKQSSVQLSTYFVGRMAFYRLRQQVQAQLGDKFDLGRFHEAVLDHGSIPVKYLPELVGARLNQPR
jgi:uncharacterized protein (DUF885 family)